MTSPPQNPWPAPNPAPRAAPGGDVPGVPTAPPPAAYRIDTTPKLPVVATPYHHFFRTPSYRWWRSLLALVLGAVGFVLVNLVVAGPVAVYEYLTGARSADEVSLGTITVTPLLFAANNLAIALTIPVATLTTWLCFGMRPTWLSSVTGGIRWGFLLLCFAVCCAPYGVLTALGVAGAFDQLRWGPWSLFMILTILLTTPFQAAGEEYGFRGLYNRALAAWVPNRLGGAILGGLVSSVFFMLLHGAGDPSLNVFYFLIGVIASRLAYRTGGLEASIALHAVNNLSAEAVMPFIDISDAFDRSKGTASFLILAPQLIVVLLAWVLLELLASKARPVRESAPGAEPVRPAAPPASPSRPGAAGPTAR